MGLLDKFRHKEDTGSESKQTLKQPISATYFTGMKVPGLALFVIVVLLLIALLYFNMSPKARLRNISQPYTYIEAVSSDTYKVQTKSGDEKTFEIRTQIHTPFYNADLDHILSGATVYYKDGVLYYIEADENGKESIETVNELIIEIDKKYQ